MADFMLSTCRGTENNVLSMPRKKSSRPPPRDPSDGDISSPFLPDKRSFRNEDIYHESRTRRGDRNGKSSGRDRRKKKNRDPRELDESVHSEEYDDFIGQNTKSSNGNTSMDDEESGYLGRRAEKVDKAVLTSEDDKRRNRNKIHPELLHDDRTQDRYDERPSYRSKPSKRPKNKWYKNTPYDASNNNRRFESDYNASGVKYRTASSTLKALEELKRKRLEAREKKRAALILAMLVMVAGIVHFMGRDTVSGLVSTGVVTKSSVGDSAAVDKVYGKLNGGDTRMGSLNQQTGQGGAASNNVGMQQMQGDSPNSNAAMPAGGSVQTQTQNSNEEYAIPPPKEKTYDEAHQFLAPLHHFADIRDTARPTDTAFFFHVPRAGGSTIKDMLGKCMRLVQASEVGVRDGHDQDTALQVLTVQENKYVNVDTTTIPGIQRAVDMGLARSGMSDLIVSSYFHESAAMFDLEHQGRAFIMLRNPIERAVSMYYHRLHETHDLDESVSIEDYAQGNGIENNWMTRFLANRMTGELTKEDLEQAKVILKEKFLIGFLDDLEESVYRIIKYNGWKYALDETEKMKQEDCIADLTKVGSNINAEGYEIPKRGTQAYALIIWQTQFDSKLFDYARQLFDDQTKTYGTKERKKQRKKDKQKKKGG